MALALGKTVYELENSMSMSELSEWAEYLSIYPLHEDRNEMQLAVISKIHASASDSLKVEDFLISGAKEQKKLSKEELNEYILKAMA
jgi:hypothetical protein